jgi:hypothetical protein
MHTCNAKVNKRPHAVVQHGVGRFNIAVHEPALAHVRQAEKQLLSAREHGVEVALRDGHGSPRAAFFLLCAL